MECITILEEQLKKDHDTVLLFTPTCVPPSGSLPYNTVCAPLPQSYEEPNEDFTEVCNYSQTDDDSFMYESSPMDFNVTARASLSCFIQQPSPPLQSSYSQHPSTPYLPLTSYAAYSPLLPPSLSIPNSSAKCISIPSKSNSLMSASISRTKLFPVGLCLARCPNLQTESKITVLAVKLAKESFFGQNIMRQCTTMGHGRFPSLLNKELNDLKQTIFSVFPKYWSSPEIFEGLWRNCAEAIGQTCKSYRSESEEKNPAMLINY